MEYLGTKWGREAVQPDIWQIAWRRRVEATDAPVVVDDVNFTDQAAMIREMGGAIYRVYSSVVTDPVHPTDYASDEISADDVVLNPHRHADDLAGVADAIAAGRRPGEAAAA